MRGAIVAAICAVMIGAPFLVSGSLWAKLPPPTEEQKAAAAAKAAKAAEASKKAAEQLSKSQDLTAERYKKMHPTKAKGAPAMATPAAKK
jgi:hypothetical protein